MEHKSSRGVEYAVGRLRPLSNRRRSKLMATGTMLASLHAEAGFLKVNREVSVGLLRKCLEDFVGAECRHSILQVCQILPLMPLVLLLYESGAY